MALTERQNQVINWSTQEIDTDIKLGDIIDDMLETDGGLFDETAHESVDHSEITGVPDISGLLEAAPAANQLASTANDAAGIVADFNLLLGKLKTAGLMLADT